MDSVPHIAAAVQFLMRTLVDHPQELTVTVVPTGETVTFQVNLSPKDVGKIIGTQGRTARAFRTILVAASGKMDKRIMLNIGDEHRSDAETR